MIQGERRVVRTQGQNHHRQLTGARGRRVVCKARVTGDLACFGMAPIVAALAGTGYPCRLIGMDQDPLQLIRQALEHNRDQDAHHVQLATVDTNGDPACRTLVFRELAETDRALFFITDFRSHKAAELERTPRAEACWYLRDTREQFRVRGRASLVGPEDPDPECRRRRSRAWAHLSDESRALFAAPAPGTPWQPGSEPEQGPAEPPACFALLLLEAEGVDHLQLHCRPHERRLYQLRQQQWQCRRLHP